MKVIMFKSPGCGPCNMMAPYIDRAKEEYTDVSFQVIDISTDTTGTATKFRVRAAPTMLAIGADNTVLGMVVGGQSESQFKEWVEGCIR